MNTRITRFLFGTIIVGAIALLLLVLPTPTQAAPKELTLFLAPPAAQAASIAVTSVLDTVSTDGFCTLREAITNANANSDTTGGDCAAGSPGLDTISFSVAGTITLASMLPVIADNLTINSPGVSLIAISGNNTTRVISVSNGSIVNLSNLTFVNGSASTSGAGIYNQGQLSITNTIFSLNSLSAGGYGAAIYNSGNLTITNSAFFTNTAPLAYGGGAIANDGTASVISSTFVANSVHDGGGAIWNNGIFSITNSTFFGNNSQVDGGAILHNSGALSIISNTLSSNYIFGFGGEAGGAIASTGGTTTIMDSSIISNSVSGGGQGGGILLFGSSSSMTLTNSTLAGNSNKSGTISWGGGIANQGGTLLLINDTLSGNSANGTNNLGGGIYINGGTTRLIYTTLAGNIASGNGGQGGGIYHSSSGVITLTNTIAANNSALNGANCYGSVTSLGYNLEDFNTCAFSNTGDITSTSPVLGPLKNNGGATQTMALTPGSPAINRIPYTTNGCGTTVSTDQRGAPRPIGSKCDIGAYEAGYLFLPLIFK